MGLPEKALSFYHDNKTYDLTLTNIKMKIKVKVVTEGRDRVQKRIGDESHMFGFDAARDCSRAASS